MRENTVTPFPVGGNRAMTDEQYRIERQKLDAIYGDGRETAGNRWEQELARLFRRSEWTQERLAQQERLSPQRIAQWLKFGEFLNSTVVEKSTIDRNSLSERRFRGFWERTERRDADKRDDDMRRFQEVLEMIRKEISHAIQEMVEKGKQEIPVAIKHETKTNEPTNKQTETEPPKQTVAPPAPIETKTSSKTSKQAIATKLMKQFGDGKYHPIEDIIAALKEPRSKVEDILSSMMHSGAYNSECSSKQVGPTFHFRMVHQTRRISSDEIQQELGPIVKALLEQGEKNMVTMSPATVKHLAGLLKHLLDKWTK